MEFIFKDIKNQVKNSKTKKKQLKDTLLYVVSKCYNSDFNVESVVFEPANNLLFNLDFDPDVDNPEYYIQYTPYTKRVFILKKYGKDEELYDFTVSDFIKYISDEKLISDDSLLEAMIK